VPEVINRRNNDNACQPVLVPGGCEYTWYGVLGREHKRKRMR